MSVHDVMKDMYRDIYGKVSITYTDPLLNNLTQFSSSGDAYNTASSAVNSGSTVALHKYLSLYENVLDGTYKPMPEEPACWWSDSLSDINGEFATSPWIKLEFISRPLTVIEIYGDNMRNIFPVDFTIELFDSIGVAHTYTISDNALVHYVLDIDDVTGIVGLKVTVHKVNKPYTPAIILEIPVSSTIDYTMDDIMKIDLLEELTYNDDAYIMGGVSANEITVLLNNESKQFYFDSGSLIAQYLKRNRKIVPWFGAKIDDEVQWFRLGTFWAYSWDVPVGAMTAKVVGFDTIGLLREIKFYRHTVYENYSIGALLEVVLDDAKNVYAELQYDIDAALYDIVVPYAWFEFAGYMAAIERIAGAAHCQVYCDRDGVIVAKATNFTRVDFVDTWDDSTNLIDKKYPTLYTESPNTVNVTVSTVSKAEMQVVLHDVPISISGSVKKIFMFSNPAVGTIQWDIDVTGTVTADITNYGWGAEIIFDGIGDVNFVHCVAEAIITDSTLVVTREKSEEIQVNGSIPIDIQSPFIQTEARAAEIADTVLLNTDDTRYRAEVAYRGDIAITCNDIIKMTSGIAPTDLYTLLRHELFLNGALSGKAVLVI